MSAIYAQSSGVAIVLDTGKSLTTATVTNIRVKGPKGTVVTWKAAKFGTTKIRYITKPGDLDLPGVYILQAYVVTPTWAVYGSPCRMTVLKLA